MLAGPVVTAHAITKSLFDIFEGFMNIFEERLEFEFNRVYNELVAAQTDQSPQALETLKHHANQVKMATKEAMIEFMARERRLYTTESFEFRKKFETTLVIKKKTSDEGKLKAFFDAVRNKINFIPDIRNMYMGVRLALMELCDHSYNGFRSVIEAFILAMHGKMQGNFDFKVIAESLKIEGHWSPQQKRTVVKEFADLEEHVHVDTFLFELERRTAKDGINLMNLSTHTIQNLQTILDGEARASRDSGEDARISQQQIAKWYDEIRIKFGHKLGAGDKQYWEHFELNAEELAARKIAEAAHIQHLSGTATET